VSDDAPRRTVPITLLTLQNVDGVLHKYREDDVADPRNEYVTPMCHERNRDPDRHLRDQVANSSALGGKWCSRGCRFMGDSIDRERR
jgi:hypothetical protein